MTFGVLFTKAIAAGAIAICCTACGTTKTITADCPKPPELTEPVTSVDKLPDSATPSETATAVLVDLLTLKSAYEQCKTLLEAYK